MWKKTLSCRISILCGILFFALFGALALEEPDTREHRSSPAPIVPLFARVVPELTINTTLKPTGFALRVVRDAKNLFTVDAASGLTVLNSSLNPTGTAFSVISGAQALALEVNKGVFRIGPTGNVTTQGDMAVAGTLATSTLVLKLPSWRGKYQGEIHVSTSGLSFSSVKDMMLAIPGRLVIEGLAHKYALRGRAVALFVDCAGQVGTMASSRRYKKDIKDLPSVSAVLMQLRPVSFRYTEQRDDSVEYGLIAEEVAAVFPDLVVYDAQKPESVVYHKLPLMLLKEVQEQRHVIALQQERIEKLEQQVTFLTNSCFPFLVRGKK